ncbi:hypothetical protein IMZ48_06505 [Candidatus Bathyarchaeota archaeon]|nr:hypothetical protein [Candidatus Bathyarchaeota archaeon]
MERKATIWWALFRYLPDLRGAITPDTVDRAENAITLESVLQACIDAFDCSLEPLVRLVPAPPRILWHLTPGKQDEGENMYRFRNFSIIEFPYLPETFKLRSRDPAVPLPRRELLGAHFVVGSILYESGLDRRMFDFLESDHHELMCEIAGEHGWSGMVAGLERKVLAWM